MKVRKQFEPIDIKCLGSPVDSVTDKFMPELSMNVKDILNQFAFVDNVRLTDLMKQGYNSADDDSDFDMPDFDSLDMAEKEQVYNKALEVVNRYEDELRKKPDADAQALAPKHQSLSDSSTKE